MAGKLFVLGRAAQGGGWSIVAPAVNAVDAATAAQTFLAEHPGSRVVVANAIRSFTTATVVNEDAVPTVDP